MRCPSCSGVEDRVVDTRVVEDGGAVRRRRECLVCGRRFTTFERLEEAILVVVKRSGQREPFERDKVAAGVRAAAKNLPETGSAADMLATEVEELLRSSGGEVSSQQIGLAVLERLRSLDEVAYVRFASVYKGFTDVGEFEREVVALAKETEPKLKGSSRP